MSFISKSSASVVISLFVFLMALCMKDVNAATNLTVTTLAPTLNQTLTGNNTVTTPEVCEDENKSCKRWKRYGYCYYGYVNGYMRKVCKKTCGFCGRTPGVCEDKFFYCSSWIGYTGGKALACKLFFYKKRCPKTCNACDL